MKLTSYERRLRHVVIEVDSTGEQFLRLVERVRTASKGYEDVKTHVVAFDHASAVPTHVVRDLALMLATSPLLSQSHRATSASFRPPASPSSPHTGSTPAAHSRTGSRSNCSK